MSEQWKVIKVAYSEDQYIECDGKMICSLTPGGNKYATLIAAAPQMREALEQIKAIINVAGGNVDKISSIRSILSGVDFGAG